MNTRFWKTAGLRPAMALGLALIALTPFVYPSVAADSARQILELAGIEGGLVVHLGCGTGELTAALRAGENFVVQGLDTDPEKIGLARDRVFSAGEYGPLSFDTFDGKRLPYGENLVNLLVAENPGDIQHSELLRVLVPGGIACVKSGDQWVKTVKPIPPEIDEWTHYLHGPDNNAVARDSVVGPPRRAQWIVGPAYARSHEINSSMAAMVSAGGRLFYIWDEGPTGLTDPRFPSRWSLIARDAFNGMLLWKTPMPHWGWREWHAPERWDDERERARMLRMLPAPLPRRLVAVGDRLYVTLGYWAPVSVLDAATGEVLQTLEETALTDEILLCDGILILRVRTRESPPERDLWEKIEEKTQARLMAFDAWTGEKLWVSESAAIAPLTIAARKGRVFCSDYERIVCRDLAGGEILWRSEPVPASSEFRGTVGTLVAQDEAVLFTTNLSARGRDAARVHALSAETGEVLWKGPKASGPGISNPPDLFVANGLVWVGETRLPVSHEDIELRRQGFDPLTGEVKQEVVAPKLISWGHHYRCYRSKATERFLLLPKRGVEFVDLVGDDHMRHDWLRAPCIYGVLPANGLLYVAPHQCVCYPGVLLSNFNALAPAADSENSAPEIPEKSRLHRGPAFSQSNRGKPAGASQPRPEEWPSYRRDPLRSGHASTTVPDTVDPIWQTDLGSDLTPPVVAGGRLLVAEKDAHSVHALDAATGKPRWRYTAGGRVDSPPTVFEDLVLFGAADGKVYCLRLEDGAEVWRFQAAPHERRISAFGQVESAWPVHGSVLVLDDVTVSPPRPTVYFTAGRSTFLDGGIAVYALDPRKGILRHRLTLDGPRPDPFEEQGGAGYMDGAKTDLLVSDGADLYLLQERFRGDLKRVPAPMEKMEKERGGERVYPAFPERGATGNRLIASHGLLDVVSNEGKYWTYGSRWPGWDRKMNKVPAYGEPLVFDDRTLYGVHVMTENIRVRRGRTLGGEGPRIFARNHDEEEDLWSVRIPVDVRALVLAGEKLFLAGPPDEVPEDDPLAAFEGRRGAAIWILNAGNGEKIAERRLEAAPVFDGLIAANRRLFLVTQDHRVACFGE